MQTLSLLSDLLLIGATLGLAAWCRLLSRRLRAADDAGAAPAAPSIDAGAVDALAAKLAALEGALAAASGRLSDHAARVAEANAQADDRIGRMEMLLASLEDLEEESADRLLQDAERSRDPAPAEPLPSFRANRLAVAGGGA